MRWLATVALLALLLSGASNVHEPVLVFVNYDAGQTGQHQQHLHHLRVTSGKLPVPTELLTLPVPTTTTKGATRFDLGRNFLHNNRWLVTGNGDILDLQQQKLVVQTHDRFVRAGTDSLIFYTNDIIRGKYYSFFAEKTGIYKQITQNGWKPLPGRDVEPDCSILPFRLYEYPPSAEKIELTADAGTGEDRSLQPGAHPSCPIHWLDHQRFVFPKYTDNGATLTLCLLNITTRSVSTLGQVTAIMPSRTPFRFLTDAEGNLLFQCGNGWFSVDPVAAAVRPVRYLSVGNGFSVGLAGYSLQGNAILYRGQTIGTYFCDPEAVYTTAGHIAFCADQVMGGERFRKGIALWSATTATWRWVGDGDVAAVCGWMN